MNNLIEAAQAVCDRWDSPNWKDEAPTAELIGKLREAISGSQRKLYDFSFETVSRPNNKYSATNWDKEHKIKVRASTKEEAEEFAKTALGSAGSDSYWQFSLKGVKDAEYDK